MSIAPIGGAAAAGLSGLASAGTAPVTSNPSGGDFVAGLADAAQALNEADQLGRQLATGQLEDLSVYMAAATKASLAVDFVVAVRDRAVEAYQEIMRMQV